MRTLSVARKALDEIDQLTAQYQLDGVDYDEARIMATSTVGLMYKEFDTRVVEKAEGS